MNLIYSINPLMNFGDDLNPYIFNYLFKDIFENDKYGDVDFYGIGTIIGSHSIICREINNNTKTVFFGTGVRNLHMSYDKTNWDVRFLRGPISSNILGYNGQKYITDSAYAYVCLPEYKASCNSQKKYKFSLIPHLSHAKKIDWERLGKKLDIHIISPHQDTKKVIDEIAASEFIIAGAMHGAIMADILRIPFVRLRMEAIGSEDFLTSDMKWLDWVLSMNLKNEFFYVKNIHFGNKGIKGRLKSLFFKKELESKLKFLKKNTNKFLLSEQDVFDSKVNAIKKEIDRFKKDYNLDS